MLSAAFVVAEYQVVSPLVTAILNIHDAIPWVQILLCADGICFVVILIGDIHSITLDHNFILWPKAINEIPQFGLG